MESKTSPKPGDICLDCQCKGVENRLRNFLINLKEETLLKCESDNCMYPYNDDLSSMSEAEDESNSNTESDSLITDVTSLHSSSVTSVLSPANEFLCNTQQLQESAARDKFPNVAQPHLKWENNEISKEQTPITNKQKETAPFQYKPETVNALKPKIGIQSIEIRQTNFKFSGTPPSASITKQKKNAAVVNLNESSLLKAKTKTTQPRSQTKKSLNTTTTDLQPSTSASTQMVPTSIETIPKASLIKGHQFLKQIEAAKKTFFYPKIKQCKFDKVLSSSEDDEKGNNRKTNRKRKR